MVNPQQASQSQEVIGTTIFLRAFDMTKQVKKGTRLYQLWLLLLTLVYSGSAFALVLERVGAFDQGSRFLDMVVIEERLLYITPTIQLPDFTPLPPTLVAVGDSEQAGQVTLSENLLSTGGGKFLVEDGDLAYFFLEPFELWATDGTVANTQLRIDLSVQIPDLLSIADFVADNGLIVLKVIHTDLTFSIIATNSTAAGTTVYPFDEDRFFTFSLCAFSDSNFIILDTLNGFNTSFSRFTDGQVISAEIIGSGRYTFEIIKTATLPNACIYRVTDTQDNNTEQLIKISPDGSQEIITVPPTANAASTRNIVNYRFQERLIVARSNSRFTTTGNQRPSGDIFELQAGTANLIDIGVSSFIDNFNQSIRLLDIGFTADMGYLLLISNSINTSPPPKPIIIRFDANYQFDETVFTDFSGRDNSANFADFALFNLVDEDYLFTKSSERLTSFTNFNENRISTSHIQIDKFISSPGASNQAVYALGTDRTLGTDNIYRVQSTPSVSLQLEGLWGNADIDAQGMQISTATGSNGQTRFLFVSILANSEGESIWLSGAVPFEGGQSNIVLDLRLSTGLPFLTPNPALMANREVVGTAVITVLGCDQIHLELRLTPPFGDRELDFFRVVDQSFAEICSDTF